jgi:NAD(P)-dependent dehydrogenase (short-subunit alcohol dehydrogenase family)
MNLAGKKVIVTGAASGIGLAIATRFAEAGARVACIDVDAAALDAAVRALEGQGRNVLGLAADLGDAAAAAVTANAAIEKLQGVDILVNNAGINATGTIDVIDVDQWNRVIAVNLTSMFVLAKAAWPHFSQQGHGVILNMSSIMGLTGASKNFAYCTCKAAIIAFTKSLAADGGPLGIRVNCVCPGFVHTPIMDRAHSREFQDKISGQLPLRRMASPKEIADGFLYLASDEASYATGTVLVLDGAATVGFAGCYLTDD